MSAAHAAGLPPAPESIGAIRRDETGRIVPADRKPTPAQGVTEPLLDHPAARPSNNPFPPASPQGTGFPIPAVYDPRMIATLQSRHEHIGRATAYQQKVDAILRAESSAKTGGAPVDSRGLTKREAELEAELIRIDREVREHEMDHYRTGQPYTVPPEFWTVRGPLGKHYAVVGLTRLDASLIPGNPEATTRKLQTLTRATLAPKTLSDLDRKIATELTRLIAVLAVRDRR